MVNEQKKTTATTAAALHIAASPAASKTRAEILAGLKTIKKDIGGHSGRGSKFQPDAESIAWVKEQMASLGGPFSLSRDEANVVMGYTGAAKIAGWKKNANQALDNANAGFHVGSLVENGEIRIRFFNVTKKTTTA